MKLFRKKKQMNETVTIRTERHLRPSDVKEILAERFHTSVELITCESYHAFKVITEEKVNKDMTEKADDQE